MYGRILVAISWRVIRTTAATTAAKLPKEKSLAAAAASWSSSDDVDAEVAKRVYAAPATTAADDETCERCNPAPYRPAFMKNDSTRVHWIVPALPRRFISMFMDEIFGALVGRRPRAWPWVMRRL